MSDAVVDALTFDLLEWLAAGERTYAEAMDAWRTSCPKLPVWEDANDRGFIATETVNGLEVVRVTRLGFALLERSRSSQTNR
jgi:D-3-phosphoglycerate dehydrogenase / 2-oxoglutarate reductase